MATMLDPSDPTYQATFNAAYGTALAQLVIERLKETGIELNDLSEAELEEIHNRAWAIAGVAAAHR